MTLNGYGKSRFTWPVLSLREGEGDVRSLPELIDFHARENPHHRFCIQAQKDTDTPLLDITYVQLKDAILRCQTWLCENVPEIQQLGEENEPTTKDDRPVVGLLMDSDLTLVLYLFALMGLGVPTVLLSTRLSAEAVKHLAAKTRTSVLIVSPRLDGIAGEALSAWTDANDSALPSKYYPTAYKTFLMTEESPSTTGSSQSNNISRENYFVSESDCNVLILHSSGTTGLPKPIYTSHRHYLSFALCHEFKSEEEMLEPGLSTSPLFHGFGLLPPCLSLGVGKPFCLPEAGTIFTGASTAQLLKSSGAKSLLTVPSILEEIALLPDNAGIDALQQLHFIAFGGGLPKKSICDRLTAAGVKLLNHYGATETGPLAPLYVPGPWYDWHYFKLRTDIRGALEFSLEPYSNDEKGKDEELGETSQWKLSLQPVGWTERFHIQDILVARSSPESDGNEFTVLGRSDDLIRLATGEKVRPTIVESMLAQHEAVKAAVAFGDGQFEIGVLIESAIKISSAEEEDELKATLWPIIQEAGEKMDAHARISSPQAIIIVETDSLPRSDKGTVLRREVNQRFDKEIAEVYRKLDAVIDYSVPQLRLESLEGDLRQLISDNLKWTNNSEWTDERDFFELGMDSLQATILRRLLVSSLHDGLSKVSISRDFVYQHPSIAKLATAVRDGCEGQTGTSVNSKLLQGFIDAYALKQTNESGATVLLTGGTGSLGSHFLAHILRDPGVRGVICLNRPSSGKQDPYERQAGALESKGLILSSDQWAKVTVFETNTSSSQLGLREGDYSSLCGRVTHIVHNAWPMNFKMHVSSYESQFRVLQNLLLLAREAHAQQEAQKHKNAKAAEKIRFLFISSISVVGRYGKLTGETIVGEAPISVDNLLKAPLDMGYAQAKVVCEKIIERARTDFASEIEAGYIRVGQVAGARGGFWNADEHFASLVASSQTVGYLPAIRGTFSWLPVDLASATLAEIIFSTQPLQLVYHLENTVRQPWSEVLDLLASELNVDKGMRRSMTEWVAEVKRRPQEDGNNPAAAIADFFEDNFEWMSGGSLVLSTETSRRHSPTLRRVGPVQDETIRKYLEYWRSIGLIRQRKD
ncbi:putative NRPS-like enzyme [Aspergillus heterothallicus]